MSEAIAVPQGVHRFLDASTAHLTEGDRYRMEQGFCPTHQIEHRHGWFVHVPLDEDEWAKVEAEAHEAGMSDGFMALMAYARTHDCWWINLDGDARQIDGLAVHEREGDLS